MDALGKVTQRIDAAGISTRYAYDRLGRLTVVIDALDQETHFSYDAAGNQLTQTDAQGRTTRWEYDALGRVTARQLPLGQRESFVYDGAGNRIEHTDFNGQLTEYDYDTDHRLIETRYADGPINTQTYDAAGNRTQTTVTVDAQTQSVDSHYNDRNRLIEEIQADGTRLSYQYDTEGNRTELTVTQGTDIATTFYTFDALNRIETVTAANQDVTYYDYDAAGNRSRMTLGNGNQTLYTYETLNRLIRLTQLDGNNATLAEFNYTLNETGRRTQILEQSGRSTDYGYDDLYRLNTEHVSDPEHGNYSASYTYDAIGNRSQSVIDGVSAAYTYDDNDRLQQQGGTHYSYDDNGNTLTETLDNQTTYYSYNAKNQLLDVEDSGMITHYQYNLDGIRTGQTTGSDSTRYVVDSHRDYAQVIQEQVNGTPTVSYTYGVDLISQHRQGETRYYHYDGSGSTRALSDAAGIITDSYAYAAFGDLLQQTGSTENHYLFTGEQFDQNLNQYYLRARYYNQHIGRFTQQDTWMGNNADPITLHKYLYANADPAMFVDPTGNFGLATLGARSSIQTTLATANVSRVGVIGFAANDAVFAVGAANTVSSFQRGVAVLKLLGASSLVAILARKDSNKEDKEEKVNVYHGSWNAGAVRAGGLRLDRGTQYVSRDISAAQDAINPGRPEAFTAVDPGVVISKVPKDQFNALMFPAEREYRGFYPYRIGLSTEILLSTTIQIQLFNNHIVR